MDADIDGRRIVYEERGDGRPMVFLHGCPLDRRSMIDAFEPILGRRQGWRRIYPDLPGMGETGALAGIRTQDEVLELLLGFIGSVAPGGEVAVVGLSYGGLLAQGLAYRMAKSMSGLLAVVPSMAAHGKRILPEFRPIYRETVDFTGVEDEIREGFEHMAVVQTCQHLRVWQQLIVPAMAVADRAFIEELQRNYEFSFDHRTLPQPFDAPALFLTGRQDNICGYQDAWKVLENYPRASFAVLDRTGHCLHFEQSVVLEALVHEWIDRVEEFLADAPAGGSGW